MSRVVPPTWMVPSRANRIVLHWTAGGYNATALDRKHYHILIQGDGQLMRGNLPISANDVIDRSYAAHTRGANGRAIGVAVCCMAGATERPFNAGRFPMTRQQWELMALVAADLCDRYGIPVQATRVLHHGEVQSILGIPQAGKWDALKLPWDPGVSKESAGWLFRQMVERHVLEGAKPVSQWSVTVKGRDLGHVPNVDGTAFAPVRPFGAAAGLDVHWDGRHVYLGGSAVPTDVLLRGGLAHAPVRTLARAADLPVHVVGRAVIVG